MKINSSGLNLWLEATSWLLKSTKLLTWALLCFIRLDGLNVSSLHAWLSYWRSALFAGNHDAICFFIATVRIHIYTKIGKKNLFIENNFPIEIRYERICACAGSPRWFSRTCSYFRLPRFLDFALRRHLSIQILTLAPESAYRHDARVFWIPSLQISSSLHRCRLPPYVLMSVDRGGGTASLHEITLGQTETNES